MSAVVDRRGAAAPSRAGADPVTRWLLMVAGLIVLMVIVGGYVRLSRAGLSIVEWDVLGGVLPPIGEEAWDEAFALYQQTPEYLKVNKGMSLPEYQAIFYIEWGHRLIARLAGLAAAAPLVWFMWRRLVGFRESLRYWAIVALFGVQGLIGWLMVSSGLVDRPAVSQYRLTIHLLAALLLLAVVLWTALGRMGFGRGGEADEAAAGRAAPWAFLCSVVLQIAYGGLVAGLRAGHVSDTWPLMFGRLVPEGLLSSAGSWWASLVGPLTSHWTHRWLAFVVAALALWVYSVVRRTRPHDRPLRAIAAWAVAAVGAQIALGISVVLLGVPKWFALAHQGLGVAVFTFSLIAAHRVSSSRRTT